MDMDTAMSSVDVQLQPVRVPEWEAEDLLSGRLAADTVLADDEQAEAMLGRIRLSLPRDILQTELVGYAQQHRTALSLDIPADSARDNFYLIEVPINALIPEQQRLTRLRLRLDLRSLQTGDDDARPIVAYDLFPPDQSEEKVTSVGEINLDVSKALTFIYPVPLATALADCLGLKLHVPLQWKSQYVRVRTTERLSNPVEWYVTDQAMANNFTACAIVRAPKSASVVVEATLACELRKPGPLGRLLKGRFCSDRHPYVLGDPTP